MICTFTRTLTCLLMLIAFAIPLYTEAATVKAYKGKKILIDMAPNEFKVGDVLKIENASGKTVGLIKVQKVKGKAAQGVYKGKAEKGFAVKLRPAKKKTDGDTKSSSTAQLSEGDDAIGLLFGINSSSAEVDLEAGDTVSLSGMGFSAKLLYDYTLLEWLGFRGAFGLEQFNVDGATNDTAIASGGCGGACEIKINYLTVDLLGRAFLGGQSSKFWVGGGIDVMFPISKSVTAIDESSVGNTSVFVVATGVDWHLSKKTYIPIQFEFNKYPPSETVSAQAFTARFGYAW